VTFDVIAFDADDTLWHTEYLYADAKQKLCTLLSAYADATTLVEGLETIELSNLDLYGYGVKSFALSMVQAAVTLTEGRVTGEEVLGVVGIAREMLMAEVRLLDGVRDVVSDLSRTHTLMVITKGDASEQVPKLHRSGLIDAFKMVEVVDSKTRDVYARLLAKHRIVAECFLMVGNSLKSDILPVLELGGFGIYVPSDLLWSHEHVDESPTGHSRYRELSQIGELPTLIDELMRH
jgi:putative hydrolase of the HAD superfamily